MANIMVIPQANEIRFAPEGQTLPAIYNQQQFDRDWMYNLLTKRMLKREYKQKKQNNDRNCVQIHTNASSVSLKVIQNNTTIVSISPTQTQTFAGNEVDGIQLTTHQWDFILANTSVASNQGTYYYVITAVYGSDTLYYISEPIQVRNKWANTVLIEYNDTRNEHDVFFSLNARFQIRVPGYLVPDDVNESDTEFEDQYKTNKTLASSNTRVMRLQVQGIPFYLYEKLKIASGMRVFKVENYRYSKAASANWEKQGAPDTSPLLDCSLLLHNYYPPDNYTFKTGSVLPVIPTSYPVAVMNAILQDVNFGVVIFQSLQNIIIEDSTAATALVTALNNEAAIIGMKGTWGVSGGYINYNNASNENFTILNLVLKTKVISVELDLPGTNDTFAFRYTCNDNLMIDWGDGTKEATVIPYPYADVSHSYTNNSADTVTLRIFHENDLTRLDFADTSKSAKILDLTGTMSNTLQRHQIIGTLDSSVTSWDLSYLEVARFEIEVITLANTSVDTITDPFTVALPMYKNFAKLYSIDISGNALDDSALEVFVGNFVTNCNYSAVYGDMYLDGQTPPATPNLNTLAYIATLNNAGWGVSYD